MLKQRADFLDGGVPQNVSLLLIFDLHAQQYRYFLKLRKQPARDDHDVHLLLSRSLHEYAPPRDEYFIQPKVLRLLSHTHQHHANHLRQLC